MPFSSAATASTRFIRHGHTCLGVSGSSGLTMLAAGHNNSPFWSRRTSTSAGSLHTWSPYGKGKSPDDLPGFNGERSDPISGCYHLGNGYRAYNPVLQRFNCPDSLSPFGAGGVNPYAYCAGDPVNHTDPSGHMSWMAIAGIVTGVVGLGLSVFTAGASIAAAGGVMAALSSASTTALVLGGMGVMADVTGIVSGAIEDTNPEASSVLGWVSMATGIAGITVGATQGKKFLFDINRGQDVNSIKRFTLRDISAPTNLRFHGYEKPPTYENRFPLYLDKELEDSIHLAPFAARVDNRRDFILAMNYMAPSIPLKFVINDEYILYVSQFIGNNKRYIKHPALFNGLMRAGDSHNIIAAGRIYEKIDIKNMLYVIADNRSGHYKPPIESVNFLDGLIKSWGEGGAIRIAEFSV